MDNELKAKVDEILKNKDVEKLSKDDLDNISGGGYGILPDGTISINGSTPMTRAQFDSMIYAMGESYGADTAIAFLKNMGYDCSDMRQTGGIEGNMDGMKQLGVIMDHFWLNIDGAKY